MGSWGLRWQTESRVLLEGLVFCLVGRVEKDTGELILKGSLGSVSICDSCWDLVSVLLFVLLHIYSGYLELELKQKKNKKQKQGLRASFVTNQLCDFR